jgi:Uma2 family endonuclease
MTAARALFTRADWDRLPEGFPAQLIGGQLVKEATPLYGHGVYITRFMAALLRIVDAGRMPNQPVGVVIDDLNAYLPDIAVYREPVPLDERETRTPILVVEVLSPSTRRFDIGRKRERYLSGGVEEVWLVDPVAKTIEVHTAADARKFSGHERASSAVVPGFSLAPLDLFCDSDA